MSEIIYLYLYIFFMFYFGLTSISSLLLIKEKEHIKFRKETLNLLHNLNDLFDIAEDELINNLEINKINENLIKYQ